MTALAVAALLITGSGCAFMRKNPPVSSSDASPSDEPEKQWDGKIRHDLDPLKKRFKNLGNDYTATWAGGDYGNPRVPGLEAVWLDAIIHISPDQAKMLEAHLGSPVQHEVPKIKKELRAELPEGPAVASADLNDFINVKPNQVRISAYLYENASILVVNYIAD